jgi:hypothetical protein
MHSEFVLKSIVDDTKQGTVAHCGHFPSSFNRVLQNQVIICIHLMMYMSICKQSCPRDLPYCSPLPIHQNSIPI